MNGILDVSVVIPCYNSELTLKRSLVSIQRQTMLPTEIIVIDDGSDIPLETFKNDLLKSIQVPVKFIRQLNAGAPSARNAGIFASKCNFIALLDADDVWLPKKLEIQYNTMVEHNLRICGHGYTFKGVDQKSINSAKIRSISKWEFIYHNPFFTPTVMLRKDHFSGFDMSFRRVDDYKAWVENYSPGRYGYIDVVLAAGFKPPIGHSGLTQSIRLMHTTYIDVLRALLNEGKISLLFFIFAITVEYLKYTYRFVRKYAY